MDLVYPGRNPSLEVGYISSFYFPRKIWDFEGIVNNQTLTDTDTIA